MLRLRLAPFPVKIPIHRHSERSEESAFSLDFRSKLPNRSSL